MTPEQLAARRAKQRDRDRRRLRGDPALRARRAADHERWRNGLPGKFTIYARDAARRAAKRGLPCELTRGDLLKLWKMQRGRCAYSGRVMTPRCNRLNTVSVERIDPSRGYTLDNVVLICDAVNTAKNDLSLTEYVALCRDVATRNPENAQQVTE
jgi:hypothetical protein